MTWTEETRATLETYAEEGTMPPYAREAIGAALAEIERLHAGLKSGADWIRENLPDTKDGQFVVDVLLAEIVRLKTELAQQAEECEGHLTYGDDPNLIRAALTQAKLEKAEARVRTLEEALEKWNTLSLVIESAMRAELERDERAAEQYGTVLGLIHLTRAALRGGGEHSKHPTGDYCVYCRSQWPCAEAGEVK